MSNEAFWLEVVKIVLAAVAAGIAGVIAWRQSRTAERKLRFELYEKRFAMYEATMNVMRSFVELDDVDVFMGKYNTFVDMFGEIPFLVHDSQKRFMGEVSQKVGEFLPEYIKLRQIQMLNPKGMTEEQQLNILERQEMMVHRHKPWFMDKIKDAPSNFMPLLDFKKVL